MDHSLRYVLFLVTGLDQLLVLVLALGPGPGRRVGKQGGRVVNLTVPLQPLRVDERLGADWTYVRSLSGMDESVTFKAGRVLVRLPTVPALVRSEQNGNIKWVQNRECW